MDKQPLLNTHVNNLTMTEAIDEICRLIESKTKAYIVPINVDVVVKMEKDDYLRKIVDEADLTLVDGKPLVWISKWYKHNIKEKVSGSDLVPELCKVVSEKGHSIFILGGASGVPEMAKTTLEEKMKCTRIVGFYSPPIGFEKDKEESNRIVKMIYDSKPDLLIVCLGCPKQEKWLYENYRNFNATVSICAGATVDFLAGTVKRAPKWMRKSGLEWFYRFLQEPKRLFKRYFVDDMRVILLIWKYRKVFDR